MRPKNQLKFRQLFCCVTLICFFGCTKISDPYAAEVVIIGGGTAGTAAAISDAEVSAYFAANPFDASNAMEMIHTQY